MTDENDDGTTSTRGQHSSTYRCEQCESLLDLSTWTPTTTDEEGNICRFCDDECRSGWREA